MLVCKVYKEISALSRFRCLGDRYWFMPRKSCNILYEKYCFH